MSTRKPKIQRVELSNDSLPLHCPFCGAIAHESDENWGEEVSPCKHVLFIAHDEGFEYRSDRFNVLMNISEQDDFAPGQGKHGYDGFTDKVPLADAIKFAYYVPAPSFFGVYIGLAHTDDE